MGCTVPQRGLFADTQLSHYKAAKHSDMGSADIKKLLIADAQVSRFQA